MGYHKFVCHKHLISVCRFGVGSALYGNTTTVYVANGNQYSVGMPPCAPDPQLW
ncbi:Uncharacterised protein [Vibrio cholerae]|nr:Uncharacterised protein [Vibrio cholerae]CSI02583.1 Uncharacterised protein [Vibrio cholerae]CSI49437.1 Uncharacterised protein [Vibrio cholerae]